MEQVFPIMSDLPTPAKYVELDLTNYMHEWSKPGYDADGAFVKPNRFGMNLNTFPLSVTQFDVARMPDVEHASMPLIGHVIMTRPNLNGKSANVAAIKASHNMSALYNDPVGRYLWESITSDSLGIFMPLVYNRALSFSVNDLNLDVVKVGQTFYGHHMNYAFHNEDHKISNTLSIPFRNDYNQSILKLMQLWYMYIYNVTFNDNIQPTEYDQKHGILDYGASIYYLVTRNNMIDLVYWQKWTGVCPIKVPMSMYNMDNGGSIMPGQIDIDFSYCMASDPYDASVLMDINILNGLDSTNLENATFRDADNYTYTLDATLNNWEPGSPIGDWRIMPTSLENIAQGNAFAYRPFVKAMRCADLKGAYGNRDAMKYQLIWRKGWAEGIDY